jgi:hypothetical protein
MLRIKVSLCANRGWYIATPDDAAMMGDRVLHAMMDNYRFAYYFSVNNGKFKSHSELVTHHFVPDNFPLEPHQIAFYAYWHDRVLSGTISHSYDYTKIYWGDWVVSTGRIQYLGDNVQPVSPFTVGRYGGFQFPKCRFEETGTPCDIACLIAVSMAVNGGHLVY